MQPATPGADILGIHPGHASPAFGELWRELGTRGGMDRQRRLVRALEAERADGVR